MEEQRDKDELVSRRGMLRGTGVLLLGGAMGFLGSTASASNPKDANAPPLPWPWVTLDPLEAGRRAYRSYLEKKG